MRGLFLRRAYGGGGGQVSVTVTGSDMVSNIIVFEVPPTAGATPGVYNKNKGDSVYILVSGAGVTIEVYVNGVKKTANGSYTPGYGYTIQYYEHILTKNATIALNSGGNRIDVTEE